MLACPIHFFIIVSTTELLTATVPKLSRRALGFETKAGLRANRMTHFTRRHAVVLLQGQSRVCERSGVTLQFTNTEHALK